MHSSHPQPPVVGVLPRGRSLHFAQTPIVPWQISQRSTAVSFVFSATCSAAPHTPHVTLRTSGVLPLDIGWPRRKFVAGVSTDAPPPEDVGSLRRNDHCEAPTSTCVCCGRRSRAAVAFCRCGWPVLRAFC